MAMGSRKGREWAIERRIWMEFICRKRGKRHGGLAFIG